MGARVTAVLVALAMGCGTPAAQNGHDASTTDDGGGLPDGAGPDASASFAIQYADPDHGPFTGGTQTVIRGTGLAANDVVEVGGRKATQLKLLDSRHLQIDTPPGTPGAADISITNAAGITVTKPNGFTYEALALAPTQGSVAGGTYVTITGFGTDFDATTLVTFDGVPATQITVDGAERLTCLTPPGQPGDANVLVITTTSTYRADRGYTYSSTGDPFAGGLSGGPIHGTLNVVVLDAYTSNGVPNAFVAIGDPNTTPFKGRTDVLGQITFSDPSLHGPVNVVAAPDDYEVGTFDCFDATNLTIFVRPVVPPQPQGPPGIGTDNGSIAGAIVFGDKTGLGSPYWSLVPEPRTPTEVKRVYVTTAASGSVFGYPPIASFHVDYHYDPAQLSWPFQISSRPGAFAVVAVAGLYDSAKDPNGDGSQGFTPYAYGVARGVLVGPMETLQGVDVVVDIPLDAALQVELVDPPPLATHPDGPFQHVVHGVVDLGGEGAIMFGAHGLPPVPSGDWPGTFTLPGNDTSVILTGVPSLIAQLGNGSYAFLAGSYTYLGAPMSGRVVRGVRSTAQPVVVSGFLGIPRPIDPAPGGVATAHHAVFAPEHPTAPPTFNLHFMTDSNGDAVWTGVACGAETDVELPDLSSIGRVWPPPNTQLSWSIWSIQSWNSDFDQYTYRWNSSNYWTAYATDWATVEFPAP